MTDIEDLMLNAIVSEAPEETKEEAVTEHKQKEYIKRYINSIPVDERVHVANILVFNNKKELLKECKEGSLVNLNNIPAFIIRQMYDLLKYKIDKIEQD